MRKTLWTLNIGNYAPELCELTYPLLLAYARKMGADFQIINERRFPEMPVTYEKLQIFYLGRGNDWNVFIDSDAVIFPDMFDVTERIGKDTVAHYQRDNCINRFRSNEYFRRDGRDIGSANWFTVASDWCLDLWRPSESGYESSHRDGPLEKVLNEIRPIVVERQVGITPEHLIDDYTLSLNIARYGLKFTTVAEIMARNSDCGVYAWHRHRIPVEQKLKEIREGLGPRGANLMELEEFRSVKQTTFEDWMLAYGVSRPSTIAVEDMRTLDNLKACNGIAPQDGEPCALAAGHTGKHSNVGPYRNVPHGPRVTEHGAR